MTYRVNIGWEWDLYRIIICVYICQRMHICIIHIFVVDIIACYLYYLHCLYRPFNTGTHSRTRFRAVEGLDMRVEKAYIQVPQCDMGFVSCVIECTWWACDQLTACCTHAHTHACAQYEFFGELFTSNTVEEPTASPNFEYSYVHHVPQVCWLVVAGLSSTVIGFVLGLLLRLDLSQKLHLHKHPCANADTWSESTPPHACTCQVNEEFLEWITKPMEYQLFVSLHVQEAKTVITSEDPALVSRWQRIHPHINHLYRPITIASTPWDAKCIPCVASRKAKPSSSLSHDNLAP